MKVKGLKTPELSNISTDVLVVGVVAGEAKDNKFVAKVDDLTGGALLKFLEKNKKFGKAFESVTFYISPKNHKTLERVSLVGFGKKDEFNNFKIRQVAGYVGKNLVKDVESATFYVPNEVNVEANADLVVVGFGSGQFEPGHHKSEKKTEKKVLKDLVLIADDFGSDAQKQVEKGEILAAAIDRVKETVNQPSNVATPEYMVSFAKKIATDNKLKIEIFSEKQVNEMGMGIMASVARGSEEDLYFTVLRYLGAGSSGPTLALVGKGITFDSGGISIKPSESMEWMKMDMAGAAACLGAIDAIAKLGLKINVICATPLTENLPSGKATKPGDVVKGLSGKTVEVINTDAEGRLVLSDAITYVQKNFKPDLIVDVATLTGAAIVALGNVASPALGRPQKVVDQVIAAGEQTGERYWQLPLYDEYRDMLKSYIADIANVSQGRGGGVETGAKFLEEFVDSKQAWVHLDIAPNAWEESDKPYAPKGSNAFALTTMVELAQRMIRGDNK